MMEATHIGKDATLLNCDVLEGLATLRPKSIQCVVTSPPYWNLRDYQTNGQIGLEATIADYLAKMVEVFQAVRRVLRDDGSIWVNIGDSYLAQQGKGWNGQERMDDANLNIRCKHPEGIGPKNLLGMPWRIALALQADGWYLRSDIIWAKPNPMPESCTDRPTKSHEHMFLLTKNPRYFYDAVAVREDGPTYTRKAGTNRPFGVPLLSRFGGKGGFGDSDVTTVGRNLRDVWTIPTQPQKEAHFATFPERLVEPCVMAGTSEKGCCPKCGAPWERVVEDIKKRPIATLKGGKYESSRSNRSTLAHSNWHDGRDDAVMETTGWKPTCKCSEADPVPCTVLDPFAGCATTGKVALALGRKFIGIELNPEYCKLAKKTLRRQESKRGFGFGALGKTVRV